MLCAFVGGSINSRTSLYLPGKNGLDPLFICVRDPCIWVAMLHLWPSEFQGDDQYCVTHMHARWVYIEAYQRYYPSGFHSTGECCRLGIPVKLCKW